MVTGGRVADAADVRLTTDNGTRHKGYETSRPANKWVRPWVMLAFTLAKAGACSLACSLALLACFTCLTCLVASAVLISCFLRVLLEFSLSVPVD